MAGLAPLRAALGMADVDLVSVDVFDTLLLRRTRPEFARFSDVAELQHGALGAASPGSAALLACRLRVTRRAYDEVRAGRSGEVSFAAILAELCAELHLPSETAAALLEVELHYEAGVLAPNRPLATLLAGLAVPVVAVSDTPLSAASVGALLMRFLPGLPLGRIYASADEGATKRDGALFDVVCRREGVAPARVLHVGDHPHSDVAMPKARGLGAVHLPRTPLWRWLHGLRNDRWRRALRRQGLIP